MCLYILRYQNREKINKNGVKMNNFIIGISRSLAKLNYCTEIKKKYTKKGYVDLMHNYDDTLESHSRKAVKLLFKRCACSSTEKLSPEFQINVHPSDGSTLNTLSKVVSFDLLIVRNRRFSNNKQTLNLPIFHRVNITQTFQSFQTFVLFVSLNFKNK